MGGSGGKVLWHLPQVGEGAEASDPLPGGEMLLRRPYAERGARFRFLFEPDPTRNRCVTLGKSPDSSEPRFLASIK